MERYLGFPLMNPFRSHVPHGFYHPEKGHTGIDLDVPEGTEISLSFPTTLAQVLFHDQMGITAYLLDPDGNVLIFAHLSKVLKADGKGINPGEVFALSGNTGTATTGPHVHFEIISKTPDPDQEVMTRSLGGYSGYNINPADYLQRLEAQEPHWAAEAMQWAKEKGLIEKDHQPNDFVRWGELVMVLRRKNV